MTSQVDAEKSAMERFSSTCSPVASDSLPLNVFGTESEVAPECDALLGALARPTAQARIQQLFDWGFGRPGNIAALLATTSAC